MGRPDHDPAADREVVKDRPHRLGRVTLGRLLIRTAQPARCRQRRALRHANVLLAEAGRRPARPRYLHTGLLNSLRH